MSVMGYTALADVDQTRFNAKIRTAAAAMVIHPQFFEQENIEEKSRVATFTIWDKLSSGATDHLLTGTYDLTDPTPETMTDSQISVTAYEYGNFLASMQGIRETAILGVVEVKNRLIAINAAETIDNICAYKLYSALTATETVAGPLDADHVLDIARALENGSVPTREAGLYAAVISPYTKRDLFAHTEDLKGFIDRANYANPDLAFKYELGTWYGFRWVSGPSAYHATVAGERHDYPIFFGMDAFAQANGYGLELTVWMGRDALRRKLELGWKIQRGYNVLNVAHVKQYDVKPTP